MTQPATLTSKAWKHLVVVCSCLLGAVLGLTLFAVFFNANSLEAGVLMGRAVDFVESGNTTLPASSFFDTDHHYERICFFASHGPTDFKEQLEIALPNHELEIRGAYRALFVLVSSDQLEAIPITRNSFMAQGTLPKKVVFSFAMDAEGDPNSAFGCLPFQGAVFTLQMARRPFSILLSHPSKE